MATIVGEVLDRFTGQPISGAIIEVDGYTAVSNPDGSFTISLPDGEYTITAHSPGYDTETEYVSVHGTTHVTILLTPIVHTLIE